MDDHRDTTFPTSGSPSAAPPLPQPPARDARPAGPRVQPCPPVQAAAEPAGDPGAIEYASWLPLIRPHLA